MCKHAPGAEVTVVLAGDPQRGLSIEVANRLPAPAPTSPVPGAGMGLVGVRERVQLLRGTFNAGLDGDVHRLHAWLPWPRMSDSKAVRVRIVDDDALVRSGLRMLLHGDSISVVGEAGDGADGIAQVEAPLRPDVVLMDIRMPGIDGLKA